MACVLCLFEVQWNSKRSIKQWVDCSKNKRACELTEPLLLEQCCYCDSHTYKLDYCHWCTARYMRCLLNGVLLYPLMLLHQNL